MLYEPSESDFATIGRVVDIGNGIEVQMTMVYTGLMGCNMTTAFAAFYVISGFAAKRDVLSSLAWHALINHEPARPEIASELDRLLSATKTFFTSRNKIVHGVWGNKEGKLVRLYLSSSIETVFHQTSHRAGNPKAQSAQDRNEFTQKQLLDVIDSGKALQRDYESFISRHFPHAQTTPQDQLPEWSSQRKRE